LPEGSYNDPQNWRLNGVITTATNVAMAVRQTDKAVLAPAKCDIKLDMFPPGQAATINMPNAILGYGFIRSTKRNVTAGSNTNWLSTPNKTDFGFFHRAVKSPMEMSKATPNMTKAKAMFMVHSAPWSKFIFTLSNMLSVKNPLTYYPMSALKKRSPKIRHLI
jgi:hypothetical protein